MSKLKRAGASIAGEYVQQTQIRTGQYGVSPLHIMLGGALLPYFCALCLEFYFPFSTLTDTAVLFYRQDLWLLPVEACLLSLACIRLGDKSRQLDLARSALPVTVFALVVFCYAGGKWLLLGYHASRDEQMAVFDAQIFASGHLAQPLSPFWQAHAAALNTMFMLPASHPVAWVSAYLPMNALVRALCAFADPALAGPLMVALGAVALWKSARLLWPDDREAAIVALLLYLGSGQVLFAGMTSYAMPAHLAFDLVWLWFFLLNRRVFDFAALLVGFVATGLHQPLFHPLFAAPILFTLLRERNWPRLTFYALGYAAIGCFWLEWPHWMSAVVAGPNGVSVPSGTDYVSRLLLTLSKGDPARWQNMVANLLRFVAWQHLLLLPLMVAGLAAIRRERLAGAFAAGVALIVAVMLLILPYQGLGFGYRYLHGVIGSAILLAVFGWRRLRADHSWLQPLIVRTTAIGMIVLLPLQAWMAHSFYALYAGIDRRISASKAEYFITGPNDVPYTKDLVINRPDLSNRPIRLLDEDGNIDDSLLRIICRSGARVAMPTDTLLHPIETYFLLAPQTKADARIADLSPRLIAAGCTVDRLDGG